MDARWGSPPLVAVAVFDIAGQRSLPSRSLPGRANPLPDPPARCHRQCEDAEQKIGLGAALLDAKLREADVLPPFPLWEHTASARTSWGAAGGQADYGTDRCWDMKAAA